MKGLIASTLVLSACGFSGKGVDPGGPSPGDDTTDPTTPGPDASDVPDPDPTPLSTMFAASDTQLYQVDLEADTATMIGTIPTTRLDGLAFDGVSLLGLDEGGTTLLVIDPADAHIIASRPLDHQGVLGMTVIPKNEIGNPNPIILAADADTLYRINSGGHVEVIGTFTAGSTFATDLAWVHGAGLFVTLKTSGTDLFELDPMTAKSKRTVDTGYQNINGLSGFAGALFAVSSGGYVYKVDPSTGDSSVEMTGGPSFTEAAQ